MTRTALILGVAAPALLCALVGLTHPTELDDSTAAYWLGMHLVLMPLFPLIGAAPWLIARGHRGLGALAAVFGYGFAVFYTSLDILSGVAAGALVNAGFSEATDPIFAIGRVVAMIGVVSLVLGCLTAGFAAYRVAGLPTLPGTLLAALGAGLMLRGHIYPGLGTAAMLLLAGGFVLLVVTTTRARSRGAADGAATP